MAAMIPIVILYVGLIVLMVASMWKIFEKAGQPGWAAIVPFYNQYILIVEVCKEKPIWFWLLLVPCANIVAAIYVIFVIPFKLAEKFGKDAGFAIGLILLGIVFYPMLAFGSAQYQGGGRRRYDDDYDDDEDEDDRPKKKKKGGDDW